METHDNLPRQTTTFIGREREIAEIAALLDQPACRLLTLVGPGGIGKTRLAIEVIFRHSDAFTDGTIFVPLAPLNTAENIPTAIAGAFNIHLNANTDPAAQILNYLSGCTLLLVLDNFEHVLDGAGLVADILRTAPGVRILATSREPLNLLDEWLWHVKGLPFPEDESNTQFDDYDAIQLFRERARRVQRDFDIQAQVPDVVRICRLVEGMPLAVELAAGWLKTLTCKQIGDEIQRNLDILVSPVRDMPSRHRSIRAVFDQSWSLLTDEQRAVFRRLSVFRGGFTLAAAEKVAEASLWALAGLVDKSLLHFDNAGRYSLHELLRQYGEEKLVAAGEMDSARDAHSMYFLDFLAERLPDIKGRRQREAIREIDVDFENIRVAWLRGVETKDAHGLANALDTLYIFYEAFRLQYRLVCKQLMRYSLDSLDPTENHMIYRLWWRLQTRYLTWQNLSSSHLEKCLEVARAENDSAEIALCLEHLAIISFHFEAKVAVALAYIDEATARFRSLPDPYYLADNLHQISLYSHHNGDMDKAILSMQESYEIRQELHDKIGEAWAILLLSIFAEDDAKYERGLERSFQLFQYMDFEAGRCAVRFYQAANLFYRGEFADARSHAEDGLSLARKYNFDTEGESNFLILAQLACVEGDYEQGKRICYECRVLTQNATFLEFYTLATEAIANFGLKKYDAARQDHCAALTGFLGQHDKRNMIFCLPVSALLAAHDGQSTWACEILGLTFRYPNTRIGWLHKWSLMTDLRSDLERKLGVDGFAAAWERGAKLDLENTVRRILAEKSMSSMPLAPSRTLPEPLTKRELEILRLIADGLQNQEIADQLVIALGTVKAHINAIYGKLNSANRVQAVTRARELGLLP
jgi:predicted ATPase/DNA-binding CsgD family transcriptional regulator